MTRQGSIEDAKIVIDRRFQRGVLAAVAAGFLQVVFELYHILAISAGLVTVSLVIQIMVLVVSLIELLRSAVSDRSRVAIISMISILLLGRVFELILMLVGG